MVFLQPLLTVCFFPAGFTVLSRIVPPQMRNLSVSLAIFIAYVTGGGLFPIAIGAFGDAGMFGLALILTGGITILALPLIIRLDLAEIKSV
jgi:NNP family nitrate/nitrite transporter-like MFS transporter